MLGVVITNALIWMRKTFSAEHIEGNSQNPLTVSAAYAAYMASSSNLRYQVLAGVIEERGIEVRPLLHLDASSALPHLRRSLPAVRTGLMHLVYSYNGGIYCQGMCRLLMHLLASRR